MKADIRLGLLRKRLKDLKKQAGIGDTEIAAAMNEVDPKAKAYQQKVSDFYSGEKKHPELDFMTALCAALGVSLADALASIERDTPLHRDQDWEWLMFGRQLGAAGRTAARGFVNGVKNGPPAARVASPKPRRARQRTTAGEKA